MKGFVFKHEGIVRDVGIFDPGAGAADGKRPLVVVLHGGLGDDDDTIALSFGKLNQRFRVNGRNFDAGGSEAPQITLSLTADMT